MKTTMNVEEHNDMKEKKLKKLTLKESAKYNESDDMSLLIKKKIKKTSKPKNTDFRNNYKNYQYDYEEDFYEPRY